MAAPTIYTLNGELTPLEWDNNLVELWTAASAHGITAGQPVKIDPGGGWALAQANLLANSATGIALAVPIPTELWVVKLVGLDVEVTGATFGSRGDVLWLDPDTAGAFISTRNRGGPVIQRLAQVLASNRLLWLREPPTEV